MRRGLVAVAVMLSIACTDGVVGSSSVMGVYTLRTINASTLPYTIVKSSTMKTEVIDDAITLNRGNTYSTAGHARTTVNGTTTSENTSKTGTYTLSGVSVLMLSNDGSPLLVGAISGNSMTIIEAGITSVYSK